jgi:hypothetical protein
MWGIHSGMSLSSFLGGVMAQDMDSLLVYMRVSFSSFERGSRLLRWVLTGALSRESILSRLVGFVGVVDESVSSGYYCLLLFPGSFWSLDFYSLALVLIVDCFV